MPKNRIRRNQPFQQNHAKNKNQPPHKKNNRNTPHIIQLHIPTPINNTRHPIPNKTIFIPHPPPRNNIPTHHNPHDNTMDTPRGMPIHNNTKTGNTMKLVDKNGKLPYKIPKNINWEIDDYARYLMQIKAKNDPTFKRCFSPRYDITNLFHKRLASKIFGKIKGHFIIFIRGLQGVDVGTGQHKSSCAIELHQLYDSTPAINKIGFSNDDLLARVQEIIELDKPIKHTVFIRDETPESLRHRSNIEFNTLKDAIRQRQISFILVKPEMESLSSATFVLEPLYHSTNLQWVKVAIYVEGAGYIGYIIIKIHLNNKLWTEYKPHKDEYLDKVVNRQTNKFGHRELAEHFVKTPQYQKCIHNGKIVRIRIKKYLREVFPNITNDEARFVQDTVAEIHEETEFAP